MLRRKVIAIQAFLKKKKKAKSQINNITHHLNELKKEQETLKSAQGRTSAASREDTRSQGRELA